MWNSYERTFISDYQRCKKITVQKILIGKRWYKTISGKKTNSEKVSVECEDLTKT